MLQRCIDSSTIAAIDYQKDDVEVERAREIQPLLIFSSERYWRVLAVNGGRIKQYILNKIMDVRPTTRHFKKVPQEQIDRMFEHSFKSWIGTDKFAVKIRLSKVWADRLKPRWMMETEEITKNSDGSVDFSTTVNSLEEVASWVVSRGGGVTALEPPRLKEMVVELAKGALGNYA
jgi:predicted DNA-binding transcriptional regulator YafY